ncbi:hypothetical protein STAFG_1125 [Streptomyces afghaniensis 772]|uniref:Uncharacterized protein n=1 Tax=Streptomyces afghaniensis 772 TaxID=1283301 RepID=S4N332_9ACTN|nr:hypothetical protein STAFG_1125 [Streptomyces afghaniensis 772]
MGVARGTTRVGGVRAACGRGGGGSGPRRGVRLRLG